MIVNLVHVTLKYYSLAYTIVLKFIVIHNLVPLNEQILYIYDLNLENGSYDFQEILYA